MQHCWPICGESWLFEPTLGPGGARYRYGRCTVLYIAARYGRWYCASKTPNPIPLGYTVLLITSYLVQYLSALLIRPYYQYGIND